jgi:hypothetical protein
MSGQPVQADFAAAIKDADAAAEPGTALLVVGSALSWHQPLWAPLWTARPLLYDNWLWFWHPFHFGTPGYVFQNGNAYPDPDQTLQATYLEHHGIGAVVVTGPVRATAARSPGLRRVHSGDYDVYVVTRPFTTVSSSDRAPMSVDFTNETIAANATAPADAFTVRVNWFPRWTASVDGRPALVERTADGYINVRSNEPGRSLQLVYAIQPPDWVARVLALVGLVVALAATTVRLRVGTPT